MPDASSFLPRGLTFLFLASTAAAQATPWNPVEIPYPPGSTLEWPSTPDFAPDAPFRKARFADVDGDLEPDAVIQSGGAVAVAYQPEYATAFALLPNADGEVQDFTILRDDALGRNVVLAADRAGLHRFDYDETTATFNVTTIDATRWRGARLLRAGDLDGVNGQDIFGITSSGDKLVVCLSDDTGGYALTLELVLDSTVHDLQQVYWDPDATPEIVLLKDSGLEIVDLGGETVYSRSHDEPGAIAVLPREDVRPSDIVLWSAGHDEVPGQHLLHTLSQGTSQLPVYLNVGKSSEDPPVDMGVFDIRTADVDGDGDYDACLSLTAYRQMVCLYNRRVHDHGTPMPGQLFGNDEDGGDLLRVFLTADPTASSTANTASPAMADVDQDGRDDLLYPLDEDFDGTNVLRLLKNLPTLPGSGIFFVMSAEEIFSGAGYGETPSGTAGLGYLRLKLTVPDKVLEATNPALDHIHVKVWRQPDAGAPVDTNGVGNALWSMATGGVDPPPYDRRYQELDVPMYTANPGWPWSADPHEHYYVQVRFVAITQGPSGPSITDTSQDVTCGMTMTWDPLLLDDTYRDYLLGLPTLGDPIDMTPAAQEGGQIIGLDIGINRIPDFGGNQLPLPPPMEPLIYSAFLWHPL